MLVWDNLGVHRSQRVRAFCRRVPRLQLELLPAYAPELNPDEGVWRLTKRRLANHCPVDRGALARGVRRELEALRRSPTPLRVKLTPERGRLTLTLPVSYLATWTFDLRSVGAARVPDTSLRLCAMHPTPSDASVAQRPPHPLLALIRDWRLFRNFALLGVLAAVATVATVIAVGRSYTTTVSFVPQGSRSGQLQGLAAQFGFDVTGSEGGESPYFYVELLRTKEVLAQVVSGRFTGPDTAGDYATFAKIDESDPAIRMK